jgi:chaperonin GroES
MNYSDQVSPYQEGQQSQDIKLLSLIEEDNLAEKIDEDKLRKIGMDAKLGFDADETSRKLWLDETQEWMTLAKQTREEKTWPWVGASNVKYPLISTASMQFSARAYPSLVPSDGNIVKVKIIGKDPDGQKAAKADRVSKYMSWQLMYDMPRWEEDMDRLLMMLAITGVVFKKIYYSKEKDKIVSELVYPENFVVDYWAQDLETAERFSEILYIHERVLKEKQKSGEYLDIDLGSPPVTEKPLNKPDGVMPESLVPYKIIQQGTWLDLDDDGIKEPYTVTFHYESSKVLRIVPRFLPKDIVTNDKGEIVRINAMCNYIKFPFIPNPDGSFYDLGFGHLLGPLNESVNTLINQLVDSGTLANLQAGFVGKGLRLKMGSSPLQPGEWRAVNAAADDLRKQMVPIPSKEPSSVLYQLLGMLITSGKELASVAEIFVGKMPGQNTPATTTMASIEQGMKVFTAIYKRIYRALDKEFKKIFYLNSEYLDEKTYIAVLDDPVNPDDFNKDLYDICPAADPNASSQQEKLQKAVALLDLLPIGTIDPVEVTKRILQAQEQPNWEKLIPGLAETGSPQIQQKPDPKMLEMQMKMQAEQAKSQMDIAAKQKQAELDQRSKEAELAMKRQEHAIDLQKKIMDARLQAEAARHKQLIFMRDAQNKMALKDAQHQQQLQQLKEKSTLAPKKPSGSNGKGTQ